MVLRLVQDIQKALDNNLYFVALNSALTLPDICGKVAFPEKRNKERYILWYDEEIGKYEKNPKDTENMPYLSGNVIYNLRCSILHEGNPNISSRVGIDHFSVVIEEANEFDFYFDLKILSNLGGKQDCYYRMSARRICMILCNVAESYYIENKDKFHFNYDIIDKDKIAGE